MKEIIFAGGSHYGLGGYKSLWNYFDVIYLIKENPKEIIDSVRNCDCIIETFDSVECQYAFLGGYSKFITQSQLDKKKYINVHGALLPKYRGMHGTFYAIMNDEKELGITFHLVDRYMDSGDIIAQFSFPYHGQIIQEINDSIDDLVYKHAGEVIHDYMEGKIKAFSQNDDEALFGAKRNLNDCLIDFSMSNILLRRFFKALTPNYPYPMLNIRGNLYEVLPDVEIVEKNYYGPLGRVVFVNERGTWIKTGDGFLIVRRVRKYGEEIEKNLSNLIPIGYRFKFGQGTWC